jgi:F-type H+-transporting ATPase subunit b
MAHQRFLTIGETLMAYTVAVKPARRISEITSSLMALGASLMALGIAIAARPVSAAESGGLPQLDFETWPTQIFWLVVSFVVAYLLMSRAVTPLIGAVLEDRHARLDDDMQRTRKATDEAEEIRLNFEKTLTEARAEAAEKTRESTAAALAEAEEKNADAAKSLAAKISEAEAAIMASRMAALKELDDVATDGAIETTALLTGIKITKADAKKAVQAAAKAMPAMEQN